MRTLILTLLLISSAAVAGPKNDWAETDRGMRDYLADGYQVVGFSVMPIENRIMPVTAFRFVLQKGASVVICSEKVNGNGDQVHVACHELR